MEVPQVPIVEPPQIGVVPGIKGKRKFPWEYVLLASISGVAALSAGFAFLQWKHASVGRKVSKDVLGLLKGLGATVNKGSISGGPVTVQMPVDVAVTRTVENMIDEVVEIAKRKGKAKTHAQQPQAPPVDYPQTNTPQQPQQAMARKGGRGSAVGAVPAVMPDPDDSRRGSTRMSEQPEFPEPAISGRTGEQVSRTTEDPMGSQGPIGMLQQSGYPAEGSANSNNDFSYQPIVPPGMRPPGQIPMDD